MKDCQFGVSPVNYSDSDSDSGCVAAEVPASKVLRDSVVVNSSGSWFHSLIFDGENNISYLRQSFVFTAPTYGDGQG